MKLLIFILFPLCAFAQQQDSSMFVATGSASFTWKTPSQVKGFLSLSNISGTWADSTRTALWNAINGKQASLSGTGFIKSTAGTISYDNSTYLTTASAASTYAPLASPAFTGTPTGIGIPAYGWVSGSNATTTGQALTDVTGLSVALTTSATYEFEAVMSVSTSAVTTGTGYGVNYSVAGGAVEASVTGSASTTATKTLRLNAFNNVSQVFLATSAQTGGILIKGRVTTGANAGNLTIQHLKVTSGTSTVFIGSFLKVIRIQ